MSKELDLTFVKTVDEVLSMFPKYFEGKLYVSKHFEMDLYRLYVYDESRVPAHDSHLEYKEKFKYYDFAK